MYRQAKRGTEGAYDSVITHYYRMVVAFLIVEMSCLQPLLVQLIT